MKNKWKIDDATFEQLVAPYRTMSAGATLPHPDVFPTELLKLQPKSIRPRNEERNAFLGNVITKPSEKMLVFGFSYLDSKDNQEDEDIYALDLENKEMTYFPKGSFEEEFPEYKGTHKGDKSYLRDKNK